MRLLFVSVISIFHLSQVHAAPMAGYDPNTKTCHFNEDSANVFAKISAYVKNLECTSSLMEAGVCSLGVATAAGVGSAIASRANGVHTQAFNLEDKIKKLAGRQTHFMARIDDARAAILDVNASAYDDSPLSSSTYNRAIRGEQNIPLYKEKHDQALKQRLALQEQLQRLRQAHPSLASKSGLMPKFLRGISQLLKYGAAGASGVGTIFIAGDLLTSGMSSAGAKEMTHKEFVEFLTAADSTQCHLMLNPEFAPRLESLLNKETAALKSEQDNKLAADSPEVSVLCEPSTAGAVIFHVNKGPMEVWRSYRLVYASDPDRPSNRYLELYQLSMSRRDPLENNENLGVLIRASYFNSQRTQIGYTNYGRSPVKYASLDTAELDPTDQAAVQNDLLYVNATSAVIQRICEKVWERQ